MKITKDGEKGGNNKQHLNLSTLAYEVISSDMFTFGVEKFGTFINNVFDYYHPLAEASISITLNHLKGKLEKCLSNIPGDEKTKQRVLERIVSQKKESLIEKAEFYESGEAFKFWLNKKNFDYLTETQNECGEDKYYSSRGKYIKNVIEEYARLPYIKRENIYFHPWIEEIQDAIQSKKQLKVVTDENKVYSVYPYKILSDPLSTANYLVGYCTEYDNSDNEKQPCSFRISALKSIKLERSKSAFLKNDLRVQLAQIISSRGVQFMVGNEAEIHVKLTEAGIKKYRRQMHLRPPRIREQDDGVYVFQCTTAQAEFYFFKFGKDAEIIQPAELRDKFKSMYEEAANIYTLNKGEDDK